MDRVESREDVFYKRTGGALEEIKKTWAGHRSEADMKKFEEIGKAYPPAGSER